MTEYLRCLFDIMPIYDAAGGILADLSRAAGTNRFHDLCSGSGGPWPRLIRLLRASDVTAQVTLSDLYPDTDGRASRIDGIEYHPEPLDFEGYVPNQERIVTIFTALHHFEPKDVEALFRKLAASRTPCAIFEATERSLRGALAVALTPLLTLLLTAVSRPSLKQIFLTYVIPWVPSATTFDGIVSVFKTYTPAELSQLTRSASTEDYEWTVGTCATRWSPMPVSFVVGRPRGMLEDMQSEGRPRT